MDIFKVSLQLTAFALKLIVPGIGTVMGGKVWNLYLDRWVAGALKSSCQRALLAAITTRLVVLSNKHTT